MRDVAAAQARRGASSNLENSRSVSTCSCWAAAVPGTYCWSLISVVKLLVLLLQVRPSDFRPSCSFITQDVVEACLAQQDLAAESYMIHCLNCLSGCTGVSGSQRSRRGTISLQLQTNSPDMCSDFAKLQGHVQLLLMKTRDALHRMIIILAPQPMVCS